jgi:hypothetical protein
VEDLAKGNQFLTSRANKLGADNDRYVDTIQKVGAPR